MDEGCVLWSFDHFYHMDKANAAIHCAPVKFSPITFRLAHRLLSIWDSSDITMELAEVRAHMNQYEEDTGR